MAITEVLKAFLYSKLVGGGFVPPVSVLRDVLTLLWSFFATHSHGVYVFLRSCS